MSAVFAYILSKPMEKNLDWKIYFIKRKAFVFKKRQKKKKKTKRKAFPHGKPILSISYLYNLFEFWIFWLCRGQNSSNLLFLYCHDHCLIFIFILIYYKFPFFLHIVWFWTNHFDYLSVFKHYLFQKKITYKLAKSFSTRKKNGIKRK